MEEVKKEKKSLKGYWLTTFLIGLGFFTMGLMDPLYDNYVPIFLGYYIEHPGYHTDTYIQRTLRQDENKDRAKDALYHNAPAD